MTYDIVLIVKSSEPELISMTQDCINSLRNVEREIKFNIIIVETFDYHPYKSINMQLHYPEPVFNYNKALNVAIPFCKNKYILFCNNDLIFHRGFDKALQLGFDVGYMSLSPLNDERYRVIKSGLFLEGYRVGSRIMGWCIAVDRDIFKAIGKFDEGVEFWYSDHLYAHQIKKAGIKHALCVDSFVEHLENKTLNLCDIEESFQKTERTISGIY